MYDFIAFDVETTGVRPGEDQIIELGAVLFVGGKPKDKFNSLAKPSIEIPAESSRVNGITNEMVADAPSLESAVKGFTTFCGDHLLVAHNAPFDVKFVGQAIQDLQIPGPTGLVVDTYKIAKQTMRDLYNYRLEGLAKHFGVKEVQFHRATDDSLCCGEVFMHLVKNLSETRGEKLVAMDTLINLTGEELRFPKVQPSAQMGLF